MDVAPRRDGASSPGGHALRLGALLRHVLVLAMMAAPAACSRSEAAPSRVDASAPAAGARAEEAKADAGGKPFGAFCVSDEHECAQHVCFHKRLKTPDAGKEGRGKGDAVEHDGYCSLACNDDSDCPVPLTKGRCGARGMCKRPE